MTPNLVGNLPASRRLGATYSNHGDYDDLRKILLLRTARRRGYFEWHN